MVVQWQGREIIVRERQFLLPSFENRSIARELLRDRVVVISWDMTAVRNHCSYFYVFP